MAASSASVSAASVSGPPQPSGRRRALPTTPDDKLAEGERLKDEGNGFFKQGLHKKARSRYNRVFAYTRGLGAGSDAQARDESTQMAMAFAQQRPGPELSDAQQQRLTNLNVSVWLNLAAAELKMEEPARAIPHCDQVLAIADPADDAGAGAGAGAGADAAPQPKPKLMDDAAARKAATKAHFRKGQALLQLGDLDKAQASLTAASAIDRELKPDKPDKAIAAELRKLERAFQKHLKSERKRWAGAFAVMKDASSKPAPAGEAEADAGADASADAGAGAAAAEGAAEAEGATS